MTLLIILLAAYSVGLIVLGTWIGRAVRETSGFFIADRTLGTNAPIFDDRIVHELPELLAPGDVLVMNDTRVIAAALSGTRERNGARARVSFNLTSRLDASRWRALARPAKRLEVGDRVRLGESGEVCLAGALDATVASKGEAGEVELAFDLAGPDLDLAIAAVGRMPIVASN